MRNTINPPFAKDYGRFPRRVYEISAVYKSLDFTGILTVGKTFTEIMSGKPFCYNILTADVLQLTVAALQSCASGLCTFLDLGLKASTIAGLGTTAATTTATSAIYITFSGITATGSAATGLGVGLGIGFGLGIGIVTALMGVRLIKAIC